MTPTLTLPETQVTITTNIITILIVNEEKQQKILHKNM